MKVVVTRVTKNIRKQPLVTEKSFQMEEPKASHKKICYIYNEELIRHCDRLPSMLGRASIVQDLINSYKLLHSNNVVAVKSLKTNEDNLKNFHSSSYVDFLKYTNECDNFDLFEEEQNEYGLTYDCPLLENCFDLVSSIAGGTITAATLMCHGVCDVAINWFGGWHHAQRDKAEGFCYVNDVVLGIQKLQKKFPKILYIDLDVHHGDGVQNAFEYSKNVLTLSFHKKVAGFYPGTGSIDEIGNLSGTCYSMNVPFTDGIGDKNYTKLFNGIFEKVYDAFSPNSLVVQCGGDILYGDRVGQCNVSMATMGICLQRILSCNKPCLILGGGGYNFANTARYWAYLTSLIVKEELSEDIPDDCENFILYGPSYELDAGIGNLKDSNSDDYIDYVIKTINSFCDCIKND